MIYSNCVSQVITSCESTTEFLLQYAFIILMPNGHMFAFLQRMLWAFGFILVKWSNDEQEWFFVRRHEMGVVAIHHNSTNTAHTHQIVVVIYSIKHITTRMYSKIRLWCKKKIYIHHIKNKYNATYENASDLLVYAVFTYSKSGFVR